MTVAAERESAADEFKRVLTAAMKTIADDPELTVTFGSDQPSLAGNKAKLPQIANNFTSRDVAITRGISDSFALRLSNHSDQIHARYRPEGKNARAVFEAVEQARIEALGANAMTGMAANLDAMLDDRYRRKDVARYTDRKDAPLEDAVALIVREKLTGRAPPEAALPMVGMWRQWVEDKAKAQLAHLTESLHDQTGFSRMSRDIIAALDMADELGDDPDQNDESDDNQDADPDAGERSETSEGEEQDSQQSAMEELQDAEALAVLLVDDAVVGMRIDGVLDMNLAAGNQDGRTSGSGYRNVAPGDDHALVQRRG